LRYLGASTIAITIAVPAARRHNTEDSPIHYQVLTVASSKVFDVLVLLAHDARFHDGTDVTLSAREPSVIDKRAI